MHVVSVVVKRFPLLPNGAPPRQVLNSQNRMSLLKPSKRTRRQTAANIRQGPEGKLYLPDDAGTILYLPNFLTRQQADTLLSQTAHAESWARTPITFFGKSVLQPRDTAFFGTKLYSYSDERRAPTGWDEDPPASTALHELGLRIEQCLELPRDWFNVILANRYHNGHDFMGWHADNERSLGDEPTIASISLGTERRFLIRRKGGSGRGQSPEKIEYRLAHGSLLVMMGKMQSTYQHSLPKVALSRCNSLRTKVKIVELGGTFSYRIDPNDFFGEETLGMKAAFASLSWESANLPSFLSK